MKYRNHPPALRNSGMQPIVYIIPRAFSGCGRPRRLTRARFPLSETCLFSAGRRFFRNRSVRARHCKKARQNEGRGMQTCYYHIQSASIWSPVTLLKPTSPPSQDRQSSGPRLTGAGADGTLSCVPSLRSVSETSGTWCPRRVLKSVSRRRHFAGDSDAMPTAEVAVVTEGTKCEAEEGVGEVVRAAGALEVFAGSRRGTTVRRSPVESTDGGLSANRLAKSIVQDRVNLH
jgi:hypothetical protein